MKKVIIVISLLLGIAAACNDNWDDYYHGESRKNVEAVEGTLGDYLDSDGRFSAFLEMVKETGLEGELARQHNMTLWIPVNGAFEGTEEMTLEEKRQLVKNHLNYGLVTSLEKGKKLTMFSGKVLTIGYAGEAWTLYGKQVDEGVRVANAVVYPVSGWLEPKMNLYEYIERAEERFSVFRDTILARNDTVFLPDESFPLGVDKQGNVIYDSVFMIQNTYLDAGDIREEDGEFTLFIPTNEAIDSLFRLMNDFYVTSGKDMTRADTVTFFSWIVESSLYSGRIENYGEAKSYNSVFKREWRPEKFSVDPVPAELTNGLAYTVNVHYVPRNMYLETVTFYPVYIWDLYPDDATERSRHYRGNVSTNPAVWYGYRYLNCYASSYGWLEFETYSKNRKGEIVPGKIMPGRYKVTSSHYKYLEGLMLYYINHDWFDQEAYRMGSFDEGSGYIGYIGADGLHYDTDYFGELTIFSNYEIPDEWGYNTLKVLIYDYWSWHYVNISYIRFTPLEDNY